MKIIQFRAAVASFVIINLFHLDIYHNVLTMDLTVVVSRLLGNLKHFGWLTDCGAIRMRVAQCSI